MITVLKVTSGFWGRLDKCFFRLLQGFMGAGFEVLLDVYEVDGCSLRALRSPLLERLRGSEFRGSGLRVYYNGLNNYPMLFWGFLIINIV